jgi:hypothetical protein
MQILYSGLFGEGHMDDKVWLLKTHYPWMREKDYQIEVPKVIVCVRNPFDAIASSFNILGTFS